MENSPYLIGRFLNLVDGLHAVWCKNVRDNQLPPQLLGSSLFASFQQNPAQAFASMEHRLVPYLAWATTNCSEDANLSKWFKKKIGKVANSIHQAGIPQRLSDMDKAEMLLGYLAHFGKNTDTDPRTEDTIHTQSVNS